METQYIEHLKAVIRARLPSWIPSRMKMIGMSYGDLEKASGVAASVIHRTANGETVPEIPTLFAICKGLRVDPLRAIAHATNPLPGSNAYERAALVMGADAPNASPEAQRAFVEAVERMSELTPTKQ